MKFAKILFWIAGIWGVLVLAPLYFIFNLIGQKDPPPVTHPGFYYGFVGLGLAWQIVFVIIATDPVRFRPIIAAAVVEKFAYAIEMIVLDLQGRIHPSDLTFAFVDLLFGVLFIVAFVKLAAETRAAST